MFAHILQLARFTTTGTAAALTHYSVAMLLFKKHVALQYANLCAFLLAYWVSYFGHRVLRLKHNILRIGRLSQNSRWLLA